MSITELKSLLHIRNLMFVLIATCTASNTVIAANAQSRALPKAGFNNYSGAPLPKAGGLTLQQGEDRPAGAPPEVYNPGEPSLNHKLVHWERRYMPLRIWISPGKKLIEEPISQINAQRPQEVLALLKADPSFSSLAPCAGWSSEMNSAVRNGIEQWREFQNEGLFNFEFVDDPTQANIFVFWTERFVGDEGAGGISTAGNTVAVLYDANEVRSKEASYGGQLPGTPVIIELRSNNESYDRLQARAAHEFGHALGIKEHSPFNQDLMCVNGIATSLSASDKATIRWLYKQRPQYVMLPPLLPAGQPVQQAQTQTQPLQDDYASIRPGSRYKIDAGKKRNSDDDTTSAVEPGLGSSPGSRTGERSSVSERPVNTRTGGPDTSEFLRQLEGSSKSSEDTKKVKAKNAEGAPRKKRESESGSGESFCPSDTASFLKSLEAPTKSKEKDEEKKPKERSKQRKSSNVSTDAPAAEPAEPESKPSEGY